MLQHATKQQKKDKSCKEMGGATSAMPAIKGSFSQWLIPLIDLTVLCDWLQGAVVVTCSCSFQVLTFNFILQVLL